MLTFYKKYYKTAFDIGLMALTIYLFMFAFSYLYKIASPIFWAFVIFAVIEPPAKFLHRRGLKKTVATTISTLLFLLILFGAIVGVGAIFAAQIYSLAQTIPGYAVTLQNEIIENFGSLLTRLDALTPGLIDQIKNFSSTVTEKGAQLAAGFLTWLFSIVTSVSSILFNFGVGTILAFFLSLEADSWRKTAQEKTPKTFKAAFQFLKENVLKGILTYIKAQLKLISITFIVVFAALLALGVKNSLSIAVLSAFFDVLPLLGVSTVFVPWIIYLIVIGNIKLAVALAILLAVVLGTRQILEPKITGDSLGVSAFTMLSFMIISLSLFGVAGVILSPILIILIKALYDQGYLNRWIRLPEEEYDQNPA